MITMGLGTIAMVTWGLGISLPYRGGGRIKDYASVNFTDKPWGISIEEKTAPVSFKKKKMEFEDEDMEFSEEDEIRFRRRNIKFGERDD